MKRARAVFSESFEMGCGTVAFVAGEAVLRMFDVVGFHQIIAVRFGEDGGGRDGG